MAAALVLPDVRRQVGETVSAALLARMQIAELVRSITQPQLEALRVELATLMNVGPSGQLLDAIADVVGLTPRQAAHVRRLVERAVADGASPATAARLGRVTTNRLLEVRSQLIARTEATRYTNDVIQARARQVADAGRRVLHQWVSARDENVDADDRLTGPCIINDDGQRRRPGDRFPSGHTAPPAHPGCRCLLEIWVEDVV